ncbi:MAG: hypothetical protein AAFR17_17650 [Pseudomonadota bacterium]
MTDAKNNFDQFEGGARAMWQNVARGHGFPSRETGDLKLDIDGLLIQNGGMLMPREEIIDDRAIYHRFIDTEKATRGGPNAWAGGWWVTDTTMSTLLGLASEQPLAQVAQNYLAVPGEWSDCAFRVTARLELKLKAWIGKGKPAHALHSPDIDGGLGSNGPKGWVPNTRPRGNLYAPPPHLAPVQLLIPGRPGDLSRWFTKLYVQSAR